MHCGTQILRCHPRMGMPWRVRCIQQGSVIVLMNNQQTRALVRIREMILQGKLSAGQRVAEAPLAERLGMSRTPVRQALPVLAQEGLLVEHGTRGYVVKTISTADILDAIDLRGVMEGLAARRLAERGVSRAFCEALHLCLAEGDRIFNKGNMQESDEALYADMNARFHDLIIREAHSPMIEPMAASRATNGSSGSV